MYILSILAFSCSRILNVDIYVVKFHNMMTYAVTVYDR